jgi:hypothetical protein
MSGIRSLHALCWALPAILSACVTQPVVDYEAVIRQSEETRERTRACVEDLKQSQLYRSLYPRLVLFPGHDPMAERKTWVRGLLTPAEKADLRAWMPLVQRCRAIRLEGARAVSAEMAAVLEQSHADLDALFAQLLNDRISINAFNTRVIEENAETFGQLRSLQEALFARSRPAPARRSVYAGPR